MNQAHTTIVFGHVGGQPGHELFHSVNGFGFGAAILFGPATQLALEVVAGATEAFEICFGNIDTVQGG